MGYSPYQLVSWISSINSRINPCTVYQLYRWFLKKPPRPKKWWIDFWFMGILFFVVVGSFKVWGSLSTGNKGVLPRKKNGVADTFHESYRLFENGILYVMVHERWSPHTWIFRLHPLIICNKTTQFNFSSAQVGWTKNWSTVKSSWWFQPIWQISVKMGIFPQSSGWK